MVRIILVAVILSWVALIVAVPVPVRRNHLTSRDLVSHYPSTPHHPRWIEARSLDDTEINDLMQRGVKQAVQKFAAGVKSLRSKLSPSRWQAEKKKRQRQEATLKGAAHEHAMHTERTTKHKTEQSKQNAQFKTARSSQKVQKAEAIKAASQNRRKTWSPGAIHGGLPTQMGFLRR